MGGKGRLMGRDPKPAKSKEAKPPVGRKSPKDDGARVRDLEKRLEEALKGEAEASKREAEALGQLQARDRELIEAQEQQAARAEILRVISSSRTDVQRFFDAIASSASRLCSTYDVFIRVVEGDSLRLVAHHGPIPAAALVPVVRGSVSGRAVLER